MKKHLLLFLLFTGFLQAQTYPVNPTKFGKISLNTNLETASTTKIVSQDPVTNELNYINADNFPIPSAVHDSLNKKINLPTGFLQGLQLSINADPTKFNIAPGYYVVTDFTNLANPVVKIITYAGATGLTPAYLATANSTYVALDINGNVVSSASPFTNADRRTLAIVGNVVHSNNTTINVTNEIKAPIVASTNQVHDFMRAIGFLNEEGNIYSPNGANLQINKSAGKIFGMGINSADYLNPHQLSIPAQTALTFAYRLRGGTQYANTTSIDPNNWDNDGVLTSVPVGNRWTIQRINLFQSGLTRIQYGQTVYTSYNDAVTALPTQSFVTEQNIADNAVFRCYLIVQQGTTNLASAVAAGTALFVPVDKFGNVIGNGSVALTYANIVAALGYTPENEANKQNSLAIDGTGTKYPTVDAVNAGLGVAQKDVVYVDKNGDDSTGVLGNIRKPFLTINAALDALPSTGGIVNIGLGSFSSPSYLKIKPNTIFKGSGKPAYNNTVTGGATYPTYTKTTATALVGGTILLGTFTFPLGDGYQVYDLGVDCGPVWVDSSGSGAVNGFMMGNDVGSNTTQNSKLFRKNIIVKNVSTIVYSPSELIHSFLVENCFEPFIQNIDTYNGFAGFVYKNVGGTAASIKTQNSGDLGVVIKNNFYAYGNSMFLNDFEIDGGAGLTLDADAGGLRDIYISNGRIRNANFGVKQIAGSVLNSVNISNVHVTNVTGYGFDFTDTQASNLLNNSASYCGSGGFRIVGDNNRLSENRASFNTGVGISLTANNLTYPSISTGNDSSNNSTYGFSYSGLIKGGHNTGASNSTALVNGAILPLDTVQIPLILSNTPESYTDTGEILQVDGAAKAIEYKFAGTSFTEPANASGYTQIKLQPTSGGKDVVFLFAPSSGATNSVMEFYNNSSLFASNRGVIKNSNGTMVFGSDISPTPISFIQSNNQKLGVDSGGKVVINDEPTTSVGAYDFLTRNTSTGVVEKINTNIALTGTPTAPTAAPGTNTPQIATMEALQAAINSSSSNLQSIIDAGGYAELDGSSSSVSLLTGVAGNRSVELSTGDGVNYNKFYSTKYQAGIISDYNLTSGWTANAYVEDGKFKISQDYNANTYVTNIDITDPISITNLRFPAKPIAGTYTLATTDQLRPYKVYTASLSQSGTSAPTATVLENDLGTSITWTRNSAGNYTGTATGAFTSEKTLVFVTNAFNGALYSFYSYSVDVNTVQVGTLYSGAPTDSLLEGQRTSIEIRVYN